MFGEMELDPEPVALESARLANAAQAQREQIELICQAIRDQQAARPWGTDRAGGEFADGPEGYLAHVEEVLDRSTLHSQNVEHLAVEAGVGALTSEFADEAGREQIQEAAAQIDEMVGEFHALLDRTQGDTAAVWAEPEAAGAAVDLTNLAGTAQVREELGPELLGDVEGLMGRLTQPDQ